MEELMITLERHEQQLKTIERDLSHLREVQTEIRTMNETLVTLANELKHTNEHLDKNEQRIEELDHLPKQRYQQILTAVISAIVAAFMSAVVNAIMKG